MVGRGLFLAGKSNFLIAGGVRSEVSGARGEVQKNEEAHYASCVSPPEFFVARWTWFLIGHFLFLGSLMFSLGLAASFLG